MFWNTDELEYYFRSWKWAGVKAQMICTRGRNKTGEILKFMDDMGIATTGHRGRMLPYWSCCGGNFISNYHKKYFFSFWNS